MSSQSYLPVGLFLIGVSCVSMLWFVRTKAPKHFAAQSLAMGEMGLMAIAIAIVPAGPGRTAAVSILGIATLLSIAMQVRLVREWRRESQPA